MDPTTLLALIGAGVSVSTVWSVWAGQVRRNEAMKAATTAEAEAIYAKFAADVAKCDPCGDQYRGALADSVRRRTTMKGDTAVVNVGPVDDEHEAENDERAAWGLPIAPPPEVVRFTTSLDDAKRMVQDNGGGYIKRVGRLRRHSFGKTGYLVDLGKVTAPDGSDWWTPYEPDSAAALTPMVVKVPDPSKVSHVPFANDQSTTPGEAKAKLLAPNGIVLVPSVPADPDPDTLYLLNDWGSSRPGGGAPKPLRGRRARKHREKMINAWLLAERSWRDAETAKRADAQNEAFLAGDLYGLYGHYLPPEEFRRPALPKGWNEDGPERSTR